MDSLIGQQLGQYEIVSLLGSGGMATVYRARQISVNRDVAIKVIRPELGQSGDFAARFEREAQIVASLSHPHILKVFDYGRHDDIVYLVMEIMNGGSLSSLIEQGALQPRLASRMLNQMAQALDYAHHQGIVHRDLKPHNVLLDENGNAFLTDFGIAKLVQAKSILTQSGTAIGTPYYMSPEQWRDDHVDSRTDLYALGVMLFEMLTGKVPFDGSTPYAIMYKHIYEKPPLIRDVNPELPESVEPVIQRAIEKERNQRFPSAGALALAFRNVLAGRKAPQAGATLVLAPDRKRSLPLILGLAAALLLIAIVGFVVSKALTRQPAPQPTSALAALATPTLEGVTVVPFVRSTVTASPTEDNLTTATIMETDQAATTLAPTASRTATPNFPMTSTARVQQLTPRTGATAVALNNAGGSGVMSGKIAFVSGTDRAGSIYSMNATGGVPRVISRGSSPDFGPVWSPDGSKIAFYSYRSDSKSIDIYVMDANGQNVRNLTRETGEDIWPAWSSDGSRIAFCSNRTGNFEIYTMNADGSDVRRITVSTDRVRNVQPTWSPDGSKIVFVSDRDAKVTLYIVSSGGGTPQLFIPNEPAASHPVWSPNGRLLAFLVPGGVKLLDLNDPTKRAKKLASGSMESASLSFSPDSAFVAYTTVTSNLRRIYVTDINGNNAKPITPDNMSAWQPSWGS